MALTLLLAVALGTLQTGSSVFPRDPKTFPIAVWLQSPENAVRYKSIGINLYIGLWKGPTEAQIQTLEKAGMPVVCDLNAWAEKNLSRKIIVGWMHGDEPDNAQPLPDGNGYGPPIPPADIIANYHRIRKTDPNRPVILNLGQGVAWDGWYGRGVRTNHPEDYREYVKGADIVSFDIYPVTAKDEPVRGKLEWVGHGTRRLCEWADPKQPVWACIEATRISNANVLPTPEQTRAMVWMAVIHGATGLIYFSHQFEPTFIEAGILADPKMMAGIKAVNAELQRLAPILNSSSLKVQVEGDAAALVKRLGPTVHVFAISTRPSAGSVTIRIPDLKGLDRKSVIGGTESVTVQGGVFSDRLGGYEMRHYRIPVLP